MNANNGECREIDWKWKTFLGEMLWTDGPEMMGPLKPTF
jgi:hypothetical protein